MKSLKGHFLVASPRLADPNFFRSVVLMVQHDAEGAMGVVLNRPSSNTIADLWNVVGDGLPQPGTGLHRWAPWPVR